MWARIHFVLLLWLTDFPLFVENTTFAMYGFGMDQGTINCASLLVLAACLGEFESKF